MANNGSPEWLKQVLETYGSGVSTAYILHFNVGDYSTPDHNMPVVTYLSRILSNMKQESREITVIYSRDRGIEFADPGMKKLAIELLTGQQPQKAQSGNDVLDALNSIDLGGGKQDEAEFPKNPEEAMPILDKLLRMDRKIAVIIEGAELVIPPSDLATMQAADRVTLGTIRRWGGDSEIVNRGNLAFLVTNNLSSIHPELKAASAKFECIEVPLPDTETRLRYIVRWLNDRGSGIDLGDITPQVIANSTAGLSLLHIEDILLRADSRGKLTQSLIWDRKAAIIKSEFADVLEIIPPTMSFEDIGGLQHIKDFFTRSVIRPMKEGRYNRVPMGVLMTGPAGTGKSIMAEAVATEAGTNAVRLQIGGQIASKWQGEGERNLEKALTAISALSPTIVFMDEIDQSISRGDGNGGNQQDQRIFKRLMEYMSDTTHRGKVVFLAATNRPDLMDAALRRPGRFDKKIPFLTPDTLERKAILKVMARKYLGYQLEVGDNAGILAQMDGYTGAEIEAVAVKAAELMEDYQISPMDAIERAVTKLTPSTQDIEMMSLLAVRECNDKDLLPPRYQEMLTNRQELDSKIEQFQAKEITRKKREL